MIAVILAAGLSKRFGGKKLLEKINDRPMILHTAELVGAYEFQKKLLVYSDEEVKETVQASAWTSDFLFVHNNHAEEGLSTSIKLAVETLLQLNTDKGNCNIEPENQYKENQYKENQYKENRDKESQYKENQYKENQYKENQDNESQSNESQSNESQSNENQCIENKCIKNRYIENLDTEILKKYSESDEGIMFFVGDQPFLNIDTVKKLNDAFREKKGSIIVPVYGVDRGNPVIFATKWMKELRKLEGDIGGRVIIRQNSSEVLEVPVTDTKIGRDIDTKEEYNAVRAERISELHGETE
ncbi:nucleotidyltransferase family protein [Anaerocolumna sp. AGMB13020]|uniref:nucleotidyltransferase family protein n=1 Tax=Anaerocolumna sp. AGMB13020 TaxID=3081750 RepID=UPI002953C068|nr:nucleotidyltransferase family protein [Anaerocolumna sp. AGMB13020]WOO37631.1 nucleotidyltransferase family protein [Anaerocolumna sp. AGMB13020]